MTARHQLIYQEDGKTPAFVVVPYTDYLALTAGAANKVGFTLPDDDELVPFELGNYIRNPIRVMRIEAGITQEELARRLRVSQGYVSRIEGRNFKVTEELRERVKAALARRAVDRKPLRRADTGRH